MTKKIIIPIISLWMVLPMKILRRLAAIDLPKLCIKPLCVDVGITTPQLWEQL